MRHSLLIEDEIVKETRFSEIATKVELFEKLRLKGNKMYNKHNYESALRFYERVKYLISLVYI